MTSDQEAVQCFNCGHRTPHNAGCSAADCACARFMDNPSHQEAVCGTCGGRRSSVAGNVPRQKCPDCNGTGRIPAPVVPSDDECDGCGHGQHGSPCGWLLSDDVEDECGCVKYAPPTPSQDAEGGGWRLVSRDTGGSLWTQDGDPHHYEFVEAGIESSIRADYEELVKAARAIVSARKRNDVPDEDAAIERLDAALTHIEESQKHD